MIKATVHCREQNEREVTDDFCLAKSIFSWLNLGAMPLFMAPPDIFEHKIGLIPPYNTINSFILVRAIPFHH